MSTSTKPLEFPCGSCQNTYDAAKHCHPLCLQWALDLAYPWHPDTSSAVCRSGDLPCLRFLHQNGCPLQLGDAWRAAVFGNLESLKYIYEHCGELQTWKQSGLEDFEDATGFTIPQFIKGYLRSVEDDWRNGHNIPVSHKPARK